MTPKPHATSAGRWLALVLVVTAAVRLGAALAWGDMPPTISDAKDYDQLATTLLQTGDYATPKGQLVSLRPPLYPAAVAQAYRVFGVGDYRAVALCQTLLGVLTAWLTFLLGRAAYDDRVGVGAAAVVGLYPSLVAFNCLLLSETLFTALFVAAVLLSVRLLHAPSLGAAVGLGLAMGLGALTRSVLWVCAPPVVLTLVALATYCFGRRLTQGAVVLGVFAATIAPWAARNTRVQETFTLIDVMGGRNVMMGNYEHTPLERSWATVTDVTGDRSWHRVLAAATPGYASLTQGEIDKRAMKYGLRYFFTHPAQSAQRCLVRFFNFWQLERTVVAGLRQGYFGEVSRAAVLGAALVICGAYAAVALGAIGGAVVAAPDWRTHAMLLVWLAVPCAVHTLAFAHERYHLPLVPILAVYAVALALRLRAEPAALRTSRGALAAALALTLVAGWAREVLFVDLGAL